MTDPLPLLSLWSKGVGGGRGTGGTHTDPVALKRGREKKREEGGTGGCTPDPVACLCEVEREVEREKRGGGDRETEIKR